MHIHAQSCVYLCPLRDPPDSDCFNCPFASSSANYRGIRFNYCILYVCQTEILFVSLVYPIVPASGLYHKQIYIYFASVLPHTQNDADSFFEGIDLKIYRGYSYQIWHKLSEVQHVTLVSLKFKMY